MVVEKRTEPGLKPASCRASDVELRSTYRGSGKRQLAIRERATPVDAAPRSSCPLQGIYFLRFLL